MASERRLYGRIELEEPLPALISEVPVRVADVSVVGFRVLHEARFPPGEAKQIRMNWGGHEMRFSCHIIRSTLVRLAQTAAEKSIYQSGVQIDTPLEHSEDALREFIAERIIRALDEQKANARGLPPLEGYTYQVGKSDRYRRYELIEGKWRKVETVDTPQPPNGFTISADIAPVQVEMLCRVWERSDEHGRKLTQTLAELSIRKSEGTPTRRYVP